MLYVAGNSGVFQSLDNGTTWTLFPDTSLGAVAEGGNLPHVTVTDLNVSLGNIDPNTGMPILAGPYTPGKPSATPDRSELKGISDRLGPCRCAKMTPSMQPAGHRAYAPATVVCDNVLTRRAPDGGVR